MKTLNDSIKESFEILLENISFKKPQGIATGYPHLDNMLRGMTKGTLPILASAPSLGKTAFALNIVHNLTKQTPETGILFCSDLSNTELTFRLLTILYSAVYLPTYEYDPGKPPLRESQLF